MWAGGSLKPFGVPKEFDLFYSNQGGDWNDFARNWTLAKASFKRLITELGVKVGVLCCHCIYAQDFQLPTPSEACTGCVHGLLSTSDGSAAAVARCDCLLIQEQSDSKMLLLFLKAVWQCRSASVVPCSRLHLALHCIRQRQACRVSRWLSWGAICRSRKTTTCRP